jgi:predicted nucleic acid binding AN1-type Zn finger protein
MNEIGEMVLLGILSKLKNLLFGGNIPCSTCGSPEKKTFECQLCKRYFCADHFQHHGHDTSGESAMIPTYLGGGRLGYER